MERTNPTTRRWRGRGMRHRVHPSRPPTLPELVAAIDDTESALATAAAAADDAWHAWEDACQAAVVAAHDLAEARYRYEAWRRQASAQ